MEAFDKIWRIYLDLSSETINKYRDQELNSTEQEKELERVLISAYYNLVELARLDIRKKCEMSSLDWPEQEWKKFNEKLLTVFYLKRQKATEKPLFSDSQLQFDVRQWNQSAKQAAEMDAAASKERNIIEEKVFQYIQLFDKYHLSEQSKNELEGYFRYLLINKGDTINYCFLIHSDDEQLSSEFIDLFIDISTAIRRKKLITERLNESDLLNYTPDFTSWENYDLIVIERGIPDQNYYDDDSRSKNKASAYDAKWKMLMDHFETQTGGVFLMTARESVAMGRIKNNPRMYYRFFKHHIYLNNMTEEEVYNKLIEKINPRSSDIRGDFSKQLREYINTVYPKADLKNMSFVNDLYDWMIALAYKNQGTCDYFSSACIPFYHKRETADKIEQEFNKLVGLKKVKQTFADIGALCQTLSKDSPIPYLHMIFRGNPGTGKTTVARHIAKLLSSMGIIKNNKVVEVMTGDLLGEYIGQTGPRVERVINKAAGGVLFIDEAYLLNPESEQGYHSYREECVGTLMKAMERKNDPVIIFAGYPNEMDGFLKSNPGLSSRIGYTIEFEDYDNDELLEIFKSMCDKAGYSYSDSTIDAVMQKIIALRYEENFGNARTVENLFSQAAIECLRKDPNNRFIDADCIKIGERAKTYEELMEELESRVGLDNAKRVILEQIAGNRFCKERGKKLPMSNNMVFVGNAGTGKTSTAKLFAEMLFSIGAAKSPRTKLISAKDLYVSDAAKKLNEFCSQAMGGILFIDEIYLLKSNPYVCTEVVSVLLELLETRRDDLTVILAGYEKQMNSFLNENQGLKSRFSIVVHFDDFTEDQLCEIFRQNCERNELGITEEGLNQFRKIIREEKKKDNFGNGRTVRNIFEQAFRTHAINYYKENGTIMDMISEDDILLPESVKDKQFGFSL